MAAEFSFERLRRWPEVEAPNLHAVDAADRLILDHAAPLVSGSDPVVIGDQYGALTLGALEVHGAHRVRVHQDALSGELALRANAGGEDPRISLQALDAALVEGARVVLLRLPRSLDALEEIVDLLCRHAADDVVVIAGGMVKHMAVSMSAVLQRHFGRFDVTHARQKARVLVARDPHRPDARLDDDGWPRRRYHPDLGLWVCAHGAAFAGTSIDIGTRYLLETLRDQPMQATAAVDLACGTGVLASALALRGLDVIAADHSSAAVASARATAEANGVADRVAVIRDDGLSSLPDASTRLIVLNPPFHIGAAVHAGIAGKLFADAGRALAPGGQLWAVWNSHLNYRGDLVRLVGPTRQVARNRKFTVTVSTRN